MKLLGKGNIRIPKPWKTKKHKNGGRTKIEHTADEQVPFCSIEVHSADDLDIVHEDLNVVRSQYTAGCKSGHSTVENEPIFHNYPDVNQTVPLVELHISGQSTGGNKPLSVADGNFDVPRVEFREDEALLLLQSRENIILSAAYEVPRGEDHPEEPIILIDSGKCNCGSAKDRRTGRSANSNRYVRIESGGQDGIVEIVETCDASCKCDCHGVKKKKRKFRFKKNKKAVWKACKQGWKYVKAGLVFYAGTPAASLNLANLGGNSMFNSTYK